MPTSVTSKGQVTIPKSVRDMLGLSPGTAVSFELGADGRVVLTRADASHPPSRFERLRGTATAGLTTAQIMALTRSDE